MSSEFHIDPICIIMFKEIVLWTRDYRKEGSEMEETIKSKIEELPFVYGQTIHYVPDRNDYNGFVKAPDYNFQCLFAEEVLSLQGLKGFENSLEFDASGSTITQAVYFARDNVKIIGMAGRSGYIRHGWIPMVQFLMEVRRIRKL